jgi:hypothetical protein
MSRDRYPASLFARRSDPQKTLRLLCCVLERVYKAVDWQCVDEIRYIIIIIIFYFRNVAHCVK